MWNRLIAEPEKETSTDTRVLTAYCSQMTQQNYTSTATRTLDSSLWARHCSLCCDHWRCTVKACCLWHLALKWAAASSHRCPPGPPLTLSGTLSSNLNMALFKANLSPLRGTKVLPPQSVPFGILILSWLLRNKRLRKNLWSSSFPA